MTNATTEVKEFVKQVAMVRDKWNEILFSNARQKEINGRLHVLYGGDSVQEVCNQHTP